MKTGRYFIIFAILTLAQALISTYFLFSQYVLISLLPLLILSLPSRYGTPAALGLAFVAGFVVDFVGGGALGLTSCTLLPLALLRFPLLRLVSGEEILTDRDDSPIAHCVAAVLYPLRLGRLGRDQALLVQYRSRHSLHCRKRPALRSSRQLHLRTEQIAYGQ